MKKGTGFHWDILLTCMINCVSGVLGAPFMTPACVRTVSHASALTVVDTKVAPGEAHKICGAHGELSLGLALNSANYWVNLSWNIRNNVIRTILP